MEGNHTVERECHKRVKKQSTGREAQEGGNEWSRGKIRKEIRNRLEGEKHNRVKEQSREGETYETRDKVERENHKRKRTG